MTIVAISTLKPKEAEQLETCEKCIRAAMETFQEVGYAFSLIRQNRLYRDRYKSFEDYCQQEWGLTSQRINQYIKSSQTAFRVEKETNVSIDTEAVARELGKIDEIHQVELWKRITNNYEKITARIVTDERARFMRGLAKKIKTQNRKPKFIPNETDLLKSTIPDMFRGEDVDGIDRALRLINNHTWIFELGFRRSDREGNGGAIYNPDFSSTFIAMGGNMGLRILASLMGAKIPHDKSGPGIIQYIISSRFFSIMEAGINGAYEMKDIKECVGMEGREQFMSYFRIKKGSVEEIRKNILHVFYALRNIEDTFYR